MKARKIAVLCVALLMVCLVRQGILSAAEGKAYAPGEYAVKTAFVYNFIKFVEWPSDPGAPGKTIRLCILDGEQSSVLFSDLDGQVIMGKRMTVSSVQDPRRAGDCDILFLTASQSLRLPTVLDVIARRPVLTIGDTAGYARQGIMINMYLENKRVRFEINVERARSAGLRISTKLLNLAGKVYGAAQTGE